MIDMPQAAYDTFAKRIGRMLVRKGAEHCTDYYRLPTPAGVLIIQIRRNWLFCRFVNPIAGFILTHGLCQPDNGVWNSNFAKDVETLTSENTIHHAEIEIDSFLTRTFGPYEHAIIEAVAIHGLPLRDKFLATFHRLKSVSMAAREVVESVTPKPEDFEAAYRGKFLPKSNREGSSSR